MNLDKDELIHGYLDGLLNESQEAELNAWIKVSSTNARHFARIASLHNHLGDLIRAGGQPWATHNSSQTDIEAAIPPAITTGKPFYRRIQLGWIGGIAALAAGLALVIWWGNPGQLSASGELNRLIETSSVRVDRTYKIRNLDSQPEMVDERRPPIDGATLHVRQPDQYVLIRKYPDGRLFLTGSDGEHSWSHPRNEVVRVSSNPLRFRGPVPGNQHGIPFVNLRSDLLQMRDAYQLTLLKPMGNGWRGIEAEKKSVEYRGPNKIVLWYDPVTGMIHRMIFDGMPQARGGPNSVSVELQEQRDLGPEFFHHQSHHDNNTKVIEED